MTARSKTRKPERGTSVRYPALTNLRVIDAMHPGLVSCSLDTPLRTVARMMATYRVHAILVTAHGEEALAGGGPWGIVTDTELLRAAETGLLEERTARTVAVTPVLTVATSDGLAHAAATLLETGDAHLVAIEAHSGRPVGVVSTLDVARALAGFPERHPVTPED